MTTQTKHTPGPWTHKATASLGPQYKIYPEADGPDIAIVYDHGNADANARLIAAAPELLAALGRMLVGATNQSTPDCEWYEGILDDAIDEARAAISKARGEA